ncbi:glycosyltransferase [candidate division CSSED10-310 bacterium]|uniref:Glycosyltransferase n=1 Tax=candidate division CSSED10-310 bacterium TaxID=2855610 RepID=A0ABV6Z2I0_UNCC1
MSGNPEISVLIASYNARSTIEACLQSLEHQTRSEIFETIVVDSSSDGTGEIVENDFPSVKIIRCSKRKFCGQARNIGLKIAKGKIIAFLDADCIASPTWIEELHKAHQLPDAVIGGSMFNAPLSSRVGWAYFFCEFSQWMPGRASGWLLYTAGCLSSYKREVFDQFGLFLKVPYGSDIDYHWRLNRQGIRIRFIPEITIAHIYDGTLGEFFRHEVKHGLHFALTRRKMRPFVLLNRIFYVLGSPLIPLKMLIQTTLQVLRTGSYRLEFLITLPQMLVGFIGWAIGDALGNIRTDNEILIREQNGE